MSILKYHSLSVKTMNAKLSLQETSSGKFQVNADFHRLNVLLMIAEEKDHRLIGRKVATARLSQAKIQATIGITLLSDLKNQTIVSSCVTHVLPSCGYFKGQEQICFNPTSWHLVTYNFL